MGRRRGILFTNGITKLTMRAAAAASAAAAAAADSLAASSNKLSFCGAVAASD